MKVKQPQHLSHYLAVTDTHILLDRAIECQADLQHSVRLEAWYNEEEVVNTAERENQIHFTIHTVVAETPRKILCDPDAAFQLNYKGHSAVFYLEQDRNTTWQDRMAQRKTPGYYQLMQKQLHKRHFPESTVPQFRIHCVTPNADRRDELRNAIAGKEGAELWRFVSQLDLRPETMLHEPIFYRCGETTAVPLIKR